jgi:hypothetical protein
MSRSEIGLNEAPVAMMCVSSPATAAGATSLVRPIARFALPRTPNSTSSNDAPREALKKRAIRECYDHEIPEPPPLRRQKVIHWRPSALQSRGEHPNDRPISLFSLLASERVDLQIELDSSKPMTTPQLGYKDRGNAVPLFGSWSREPLFVDEDDTDSEMELESLTKSSLSKQHGRAGGWTSTEMQSVAVTPSPHPMEIAQSPPPFPVLSQHDNVPTSPISPPPLQYFVDGVDADVGMLDQEGSDWFISSKINELTRLHKHEYEYENEQCEFEPDYVGSMDMMHHSHDLSPNKSAHPLLAKLPGFPKPGGTIQDMMKELIIPTPKPTPPRDFVHHDHDHDHDHDGRLHHSFSSSNNDHYDPAIPMMQHPGAFATTNNAWFETNHSSFSPARINHDANNNNNNNNNDGNCDSSSDHHAGDPQPLFLAHTAGRVSSAFGPGQHVRDYWHGAGYRYYNGSG